MAEDDPLRELIEAVADGTLERKRLPGTHRDPTISQLLAELQILAGVSEVHRSQVAGDEPTTATSVPGAQSQPTPPTGPGLISGPVDSPLAPGTQWGNFELVKKVGEGTFGEVFLARDLWLGHDVALKLLKANVTERARMLHEARMLVRVRHVNVVMVHGADVHGGRMGFWMDFVEGVTLDNAIRREGPRSASEAFAWGQDLCRALAAVHGAGIVHRDVKAQNVMRRTADGRLVLMDFGAGELLGTPRAGAAAGTPMYLAPELLHGAKASRSSDIYALGVLLFFLVSRKFPVQASSWDDLLAAHERRERVRLEDVRPDMPSAFVDVVERALRPDPSQRYASAGEMLAAMRGGDDSGPLVRSSTQLPVMGPPPTSQVSKTVMNVTSLAAGVFSLALVLGYVACAAFEVAFSIDPVFAVGFSSYLTVGREAVMPFLLNWVAASAVVAIFGGGRHLLQTWGGGDRLFRGRAVLARIDPVVLGTAICAGGLLALVATYLWFRPIFTALDELRTGVQSPTSLQALAPGGANSTFGEVSALLSFLMGFAAWKWFPALERRAAVPATLRALRWATWGVALLIVVVAVIPRRIVWDEFEVVQYEKRQAFVLASRGEQLLLYLADSPGKPLRRVSATGTPLERTGARQKLFAPPS